MKTLFLMAAVTMLSACTSVPTENTAQSDGVVCTRETPIGSHFPVTHCRSPEQVAQDKAEADRAKSTIQQTTTVRPTQ